MFISLLLIIIGVVFLLKNLGLITGSTWEIIWPLILIAFGLWLLFKHHRRKVFWNRFWKKFEEW